MARAPTRQWPLPEGVPRGIIDEPAWVKIASYEERTAEKKGLEHNEERILEYLRTFKYLTATEYIVRWKDKKTKKRMEHRTGKMLSERDETLWCAAFVNWCLIAAGQESGRSAMAEGWKKYGIAESDTAPRVGSIAIVYKEPSAALRATTTTGFHVGFYVGGPPESPVLLGGNQGNVVCRKQFTGWTIVAYRWPTDPVARSAGVR